MMKVLKCNVALLPLPSIPTVIQQMRGGLSRAISCPSVDDKGSNPLTARIKMYHLDSYIPLSVCHCRIGKSTRNGNEKDY